MTSPTPATEEPNQSLLDSLGPLVVASFILIVSRTPPPGAISMRWTAPLLE